MKIAVVVASLGRPAEVGELLLALSKQTVQPSHIVLSVESEADLPGAYEIEPLIIFGSRGSCIQRNRGIDAVIADADVIAFLDDDYIPAADAIASIAKTFSDDSAIVGMTGLVLADGIHTGGIDYVSALEMLERYVVKGVPPALVKTSTGAYGCNMVFRATAIGGERFDENMPLYGWQEDNDFAARVGRKGRLVWSNALVGVHRGVNRGRTSGLRLGYSQVANPFYLMRKGTMAGGYAIWLAMKNVLMNHLKSLAAEPHIDRVGRARGNRIAMRDILMRRSHPARILDLN